MKKNHRVWILAASAAMLALILACTLPVQIVIPTEEPKAVPVQLTAVPPVVVPPTAVPPKPTQPPATQAPPPTAAPQPTTPPAPPPAQAKQALANYMIRFNPAVCTGCLLCAVACADKWETEYFPEQAKTEVNLEFARLRPMRMQYVDVVNMCQYCTLIEWAEGSKVAPCQQVCPQGAIVTVKEGEGKAGYTGMGYMTVDRELCTGLELCGRCLEICEDQFGSGVSFDPIEKKAQICSRCGGLPACVDACPEPTALQFVPLQTNGRYHANRPEEFFDLLYAKLYNARGRV